MRAERRRRLMIDIESISSYVDLLRSNDSDEFELWNVSGSDACYVSLHAVLKLTRYDVDDDANAKTLHCGPL